MTSADRLSVRSLALWSQMTAADHQIEPRWLTYQGAAIYSGLSVSLLQKHVASGQITSANVTEPGKKRGRRLLCRHSIDRFIEDQIVTPSGCKRSTEGGAA